MVKKLLYKEISADLLEKINLKEIPPGGRIPSIRELRIKWPVSHLTILRAYRELQENGYIEQRNGRGYFVVQKELFNDGELKRRIGCFIRPLWEYQPDDTYFNEITYGIQQECCNNSFSWYSHFSTLPLNTKCLLNMKAFEDLKSAMLETVGEVDGFLVDERIPDEIIKEVISITHKPLVIVNRESRLEVDSVVPPLGAGFRRLMDMAWCMGYRKFVHWGLKKDECRCNYSNLDDAYYKFIQDYNIEAQHLAWQESPSYEDLRNTLDSNVKVKTLVWTFSGGYARYLVTQLIGQGIELGRDIGVVALEGLGYTQNYSPKITTLRGKPVELGRMAVNILIKRLSRECFAPVGLHTYEPDIIIGETL